MLFQDFVLRPFLRSVKQAYIDSKNKVSWIPLFLPNYTGQWIHRRHYHQRNPASVIPHSYCVYLENMKIRKYGIIFSPCIFGIDSWTPILRR